MRPGPRSRAAEPGQRLSLLCPRPGCPALSSWVTGRERLRAQLRADRVGAPSPSSGRLRVRETAGTAARDHPAPSAPNSSESSRAATSKFCSASCFSREAQSQSRRATKVRPAGDKASVGAPSGVSTPRLTQGGGFGVYLAGRDCQRRKNRLFILPSCQLSSTLLTISSLRATGVD